MSLRPNSDVLENFMNNIDDNRKKAVFANVANQLSLDKLALARRLEQELNALQKSDKHSVATKAHTFTSTDAPFKVEDLDAARRQQIVTLKNDIATMESHFVKAVEAYKKAISDEADETANLSVIEEQEQNLLNVQKVKNASSNPIEQLKAVHAVSAKIPEHNGAVYTPGHPPKLPIFQTLKNLKKVKNVDEELEKVAKAKAEQKAKVENNKAQTVALWENIQFTFGSIQVSYTKLTTYGVDTSLENSNRAMKDLLDVLQNVGVQLAQQSMSISVR